MKGRKGGRGGGKCARVASIVSISTYLLECESRPIIMRSLGICYYAFPWHMSFPLLLFFCLAEEGAAATFDALSKVVGKALKSLDKYRSRLNKKLAAITAQSRGLKLVDADAASLKAIALVLDVQVKTLKYPTPAGKFLRALRRVGRRLNIGSEAGAFFASYIGSGMGDV